LKIHITDFALATIALAGIRLRLGITGAAKPDVRKYKNTSREDA
jgi:hypothetical protein